MMKKGVALLITVMFVIVISAVIGMNLGSINKATKMVYSERNLYENSLIVEDVMKLLQGSATLKEIASSKDIEGLAIFLQNFQTIPVEQSGVKVVVHLSSARGKLSLRSLDKTTLPYLYRYFNDRSVSSEFVDMLLDCSGGVRGDGVYKTTIFENNPHLFRNYLASNEHLKKIQKFYAREMGDDNIEAINFANLFYVADERNVTIDLNYATAEVWEVVAGVDETQAKELGMHQSFYEKIDDLPVDDLAKARIKKFRTSFFEPFLNVKVDIIRDNSNAHLFFEYDILHERGYHFVYKI